ncbi:MAG: hypothetical protein WA419_00075, partial [Silvibacterium sp.]
MLEGSLHLVSFPQVLECDAEGEPGFRVGADRALEAAELELKSAEKIGDIQRVEFGFESGHRFLVHQFGFDVAEETHVVAASRLSLECDLAAGFSGGEIMGAETGGLGDSFGSLFVWLAKRKGPLWAEDRFGRSFLS